MRISGKTKMCIIVGDPVEHSLSPAMHNAAYEALKIDDQFVFTAAHVNVKNVKQVVEAMRVMRIRGLTCTMPHKVEVMKYLDEIDPVAEKIGAVNTVVNEEGVLKGYNTDWLGIVTPLEKILSVGEDPRVLPKLKGDNINPFLQNKRVAVIGAGGAARAMVYGLTINGARIKIFNRTLEKAQQLATELNCDTGRLDQVAEIKNYDIILNSTSLGMGDHINESPVPKEYLTHKQIVFDAVYIPYETKLLKDAKEKDARVIHGIDMLLYQGTAQFELYTNHRPPEDVMRDVLYKHFNIPSSRT